MRGKKGRPHLDPSDPPRRRANKKRGHGTFANDRPPIVQIVCRETGEVRLCVVSNSDRKNLEGLIRTHLPDRRELQINTDEWRAYRRVAATFGVQHSTVCHKDREWARDADGDGIREVHCNSCEGNGAALRTYLRRFRGVSKHYLSLYCALFEAAFNHKTVSDRLLNTMCIRA